jgi:broad specificity phosphatase PhoE
VALEPGTIWIVRHAQSAANAGGRTSDPAEALLTESGTRQAEFVALAADRRPQLVVVSKFRRTAETAAPLLRRYRDVRVEQWPIEEFTYLDQAACAGTTYGERKALRDAYWTHSDPRHVDGPRCESFEAFIARVRTFEHSLSALDPTAPVIAFTHGFLMKALLWIHATAPAEIGNAEMSAFRAFSRQVSVPNTGIIAAVPDERGALRIGQDISVAHLPPHLVTE